MDNGLGLLLLCSAIPMALCVYLIYLALKQGIREEENRQRYINFKMQFGSEEEKQTLLLNEIRRVQQQNAQHINTLGMLAMMDMMDDQNDKQ